MAAWARRGLAVRPFKTGPDFLDPALHAAVCGAPSYNLDAWMHVGMHMGMHVGMHAPATPNGVPDAAGALRAQFARALAPGSAPDSSPGIAVIEGAMGLFDGLFPGASSVSGSTASAADVAALLGLPVLLIIDARGAGATAAAVALGLARFRPDIAVIGALCAQSSSARHEAMLRAAFRDAGVPLFGFLPRDPALAIPSRHLGLLSPAEALGPERIAALARSAEEHIDLDGLLRAAALAAPRFPASSFPDPPTRRVPIALARDEAFSFWYPEHTALLEAAGAVILPFSPLRDSAPPPGARGLILPGGYPELHAECLSANRSMREAVRAFRRPVYAECGGYLYLMEELERDGRIFPFCGSLPLAARMEPSRAALGYRELNGRAGPWQGLALRGHEFHYGRVVRRPADLPPLWDAATPSEPPQAEGAALGNVFGSFVHASFLSHPQAASRFVDACASAE